MIISVLSLFPYFASQRQEEIIAQQKFINLTGTQILESQNNIIKSINQIFDKIILNAENRTKENKQLVDLLLENQQLIKNTTAENLNLTIHNRELINDIKTLLNKTLPNTK